MIQTVIVYVIGALLLLYIAYRIGRLFSGRHPEDTRPCGGCTGCEARNAFLKQVDKCRKESAGAGCPRCGPPGKARKQGMHQTPPSE